MWILDYIRLVAYAAVAIASMVKIRYNKTAGIYTLLGNMFMATMLSVVVIAGRIGSFIIDGEVISYLLTPTAVIWAILNVVSISK